NRDTYTVQLIDLDENLRSFRVDELREHGFDETPMPSFRKKMSAREIADLVAYLVSLQGPSQ
ncbi:MAG TPA: c-type cytochrome, partial [Gammaproteobacteria bacterium]|nr:c-type cytochrome [Gammaproteobacteria bacterium]